jgi:outer membrane translocation and assembly module TamA
VFAALRGERHAALETTTDFSLWNDDETFRPNLAARGGRLNALVLGASVDSLGYDREALETTYRRHQFETPFGRHLAEATGKRDAMSMWRIDWTSEISSPGLLAGDFDFRRHIISGRGRVIASEHQEVAARVIAGWSDGELPRQRQFAIGGIGSVHGYGFKESIGDMLQLINLEYAVGWHNGVQLIAFVDAGHTSVARPTAPVSADTPWLKGAGWGIGLGPFRVDFGYKLAGSSHPVQVLLRLGRTF